MLREPAGVWPCRASAKEIALRERSGTPHLPNALQMRRAAITCLPMARIKQSRTGKSKAERRKGRSFPGLATKLQPPTESVPASAAEQAQQWVFAMEMGASHAQIMVKEPGTGWKYVNWGRGAGASSMSGVDVVPTMTALREGDGGLEIRHGNSALRARIAHHEWVAFHHLKLAYLDVAPTEAMHETLKSQQETASAKGWDIRDLADKFFNFVLSRATGKRVVSPVLYTNISDVWPNAVAQRLIRGFQNVLPGAEIHGIDECLSSLIGAVPDELPSHSASTRYVVVDCGHATMVRQSFDLFAVRDAYHEQIESCVCNGQRVRAALCRSPLQDTCFGCREHKHRGRERSAPYEHGCG